MSLNNAIVLGLRAQWGSRPANYWCGKQHRFCSLRLLKVSKQKSEHTETRPPVAMSLVHLSAPKAYHLVPNALLCELFQAHFAHRYQKPLSEKSAQVPKH